MIGQTMKKTLAKLFLGILLGAVLISLHVLAHAQHGPGEWQLPSDYYIEAKMPMALVHPRNDEAAEWAYAKNAHPGIHWEIPIVIQGGSWPFRYEIVSDGGASGLEIGGELERELDNGFIVHNVTDEYGTLWWDNPAAGEYEILVRVHDQDENTIDVPISLTVGTDGWVFVDADHGNDDTGDGSMNSPFRTIQAIHDGGSDFADHRVYLSGVVAMDGNDNGNLTINPSSFPGAPAVWVGLPGSDAVLEAYEGKINLTSQDFYLANLEHRHHEDFYQDHGSYIHMITVWNNTDRLTVHDVNFSRFHGNPVNANLGNSSIIMFTDQDDERTHVAVVNNIMSGENGIFTSAYNLRHSVFEKNRAVEADFVTGEASAWALLYMKINNEYITLRANEFVENNTWGSPGNLEGVLGLELARNIEFAYNTIHTDWVQSTSWRGGTIKLFTGADHPNYTWTEETPVWLYRNSLRHRLFFGGGNKANMADGTVRIERNILDGNPNDYAKIPVHDRVFNIENLDGDTYFDSEMKLSGTVRQFNLGRFGAEIAVEEGGPVNPPEASFSIESEETISVGLEISFLDHSVEGDQAITQWNWNFGDGSTSSEQNPSHTYLQPGNYTVTLSVSDVNNLSSPPVTQRITVQPEFAINECTHPGEDWIFCDDFEEDRLDQYYDFYQTWGRFQRHQRGILDSGGMSSYYGYYPGDPAGSGYDTWMKLAFGKTPDDSTFMPAGDPAIAEREIRWRFFVISRTDKEEGENSTGPLANIYAYGPETDGEYVPFMKAEIAWPDQSGQLESRLYTALFDESGEPAGTELAHTLRGEKPVMLPGINAKWHKIEVHVKLNDPGQNNGIFELRIDNEVESRQTGLNWTSHYTEYGVNAIEIRNTVNQPEAVSGNNSVNRTIDNMVLISVSDEPADPEAVIEQLQSEIDALHSSGILNRGQANALQVSLTNALRQIERNNITPATNQINAFINKVNGFSNGGILNPEQAGYLTSLARDVLDALAEGHAKMAMENVIGDELLQEVVLDQNYPNPFNPTTVISYQLPQSSAVRLDVYNIAGIRVATLVNQQMPAGSHHVQFDATNLSSGVYFYRLQAGSTVMNRKLTIIK